MKTLRNRNYCGFLGARADTASGGVKLMPTGAPLNSKPEVASDGVAKHPSGHQQSVPGHAVGYGRFRRSESPPQISERAWQSGQSQGKRPDPLCARGEELHVPGDIRAAKAGGVGRQTEQISAVYRAGWTRLLFLWEC